VYNSQGTQLLKDMIAVSRRGITLSACSGKGEEEHEASEFWES